MGFSQYTSAAITGLEVCPVSVEVDVSNGLPQFHMVGYLSSEVKEASERVRTAIKNSGFELLPKKIVVNLSPANVRKRGAAFDLPIAIAVLEAAGVLTPKKEQSSEFVIIGELGLDGSLKPSVGILPIVSKAKEAGYRKCLLPLQNVNEGALVQGMEVYGASDLKEACKIMEGGAQPVSKQSCFSKAIEGVKEAHIPDFQDIYGQTLLKRATEVAVCGGHNLLYIGPPGAGKTMLAKRIPSILPMLTPEESLQLTKVYSIAGLLDADQPLIRHRPFREVHHTATKAALIGGGKLPMPGEISLAEKGVLFLDELPEFARPVLEVLREPLESKQIRLARGGKIYQFPADFMLVAAMNPCHCGYYPDREKCRCTSGEIRRYLEKISQPFLHRIDICVEAPKVAYTMLQEKEKGESSAEIRNRVIRTRQIQKERFQREGITLNSQLSGAQIDKYCRLEKEEERMMQQAFTRLDLTARTYHKVLKVARTIADLEQSDRIFVSHLAEALGYRNVDQTYWGGIV